MKIKGQKLGHSFVDLPWDITAHILLKLPMKSILICRRVCKKWKTLISDPSFARLHLTHAPTSVMIRTNCPDPNRVSRTLHLIEYEQERFDSDDKLFCCFMEDFLVPHCNKDMKREPTFKLPLCDDPKSVLEKRDVIRSKNGGRERSFAVVNSCNGLLCLCDPKDKNPSVVCNPITGEFTRLPEASTIVKMKELINAGFGFDQKTNEYKVMRVWYVDHEEYTREWTTESMVVEMITLGTSTWRTIEVDPRYVVGTRFPTFVNGALHWIGFDGSEGSILRFNFGSKRFQGFPSPPGVSAKSQFSIIESITMGELRGSLYICDEPLYGFLTMWVMEKYGIGESWTKVFNIDANPRPHGFNQPPIKHFQLKEGSAILMYHYTSSFVYYEPRNKLFKFLKLSNMFPSFEAIPHIPSLISLKNAMKGDNVEVLNVNSRQGKKMKFSSWLKIMLTRQVSTPLHRMMKNLVKTKD